MERIDLQEMLFPPSVAVVEISGQIGSRLNPREVSRMLDGLRGNARFPAVVLDIDSPGGGAAASESIYLAAQRLAARKPVAAAIRGVGASGGYMVACAANPIFALPTSIVGSIGVIMVLPMVAEALERLGVKMRTHTSGEYKDIGSLFRDTTPKRKQSSARSSTRSTNASSTSSIRAAPTSPATTSPSWRRARCTPGLAPANSASSTSSVTSTTPSPGPPRRRASPSAPRCCVRAARCSR